MTSKRSASTVQPHLGQLRQVAELPQRVLAGRHLPEMQAGRTERPFLDGNKIQRPEARVEARQVWIMGKQCGLVLEVRDLQVKPGTGLLSILNRRSFGQKPQGTQHTQD